MIPDGAIRFLSHDYTESETDSSVTFSVDMSDVDGADSAYIDGDFTENPIAMQSDGEGRYTYATELPAHQFGHYYFLSGSSEESRETVPDSCSGLHHDDRPYHLDEGENQYHFPFGKCEDTSGTTVTFRVDMSDVEAPDGAYLTGELPGELEWVITPMEDEGNEIFSFTVEMAPGTNGAYYFLNGNDWGDRETVPEECVGKFDVDRLFEAPDAEGESREFAFAFGTCDSLN